MRRVLRDNALSLTMFALFLVFLVAQSVAGYLNNNSDNQEHRQPPESYAQYLTSGPFVEATFENWESEFLQMGAYVLLTAFLLQKGSPERPGAATRCYPTGVGRPALAARRSRRRWT